jgi:hypothetical protein
MSANQFQIYSVMVTRRSAHVELPESCPAIFASSTELRFHFCEGAKENVRAKARAVNSQFLVQLRKLPPRISAA